ncbi:MAG: hypothetical protein GEU97_08330 [Actinophytocola sp.]|nr:hypothetical protein [Actinophytocola sp.]
MTSRYRTVTRWVSRAMALALVAGALDTAQLTTAAPASAVTGLEKVSSPTPTADSQASKTAIARCPSGKQVVGGGGWVHAVDRVAEDNLALTELRPFQGYRDGYRVTAEELIYTSGNWWVQAYAICANPMSGHQIVTGTTSYSSQSRQHAKAVCPSGKRAIGSGARVNYASTGEVALQIARASGSGDITRAQAREEANGYSGNWNVTAYAVCVQPPYGYEVVYGASSNRDSESTKTAMATCPNGKRVHGAGAATIVNAPAGVALQVVYPYNDLRRAMAHAVETTPTSADWDFIVFQAICAY